MRIKYDFHLYLGFVAMKINIVAVGNLKDRFWKEAQDEYLKRLKRYAEVNVSEIQEETVDESPSSIENAKIKEGKKILAATKGKTYLLALKGEQVSSEDLAKYIKEDVDRGTVITFVIGGSYGTSKEVFDNSDKRIAFGRITFPHRLMRVVLLEQIYRAFTINGNSNYHK